jgi:hypothetical protein
VSIVSLFSQDSPMAALPLTLFTEKIELKSWPLPPPAPDKGDDSH